jgi:hypothetical protein
MSGFRQANIGVAVGLSIALAGVILFRGSSEAAMQAVALAGFVVAIAVIAYLDERTKRRGGNRAQ